MKIYIETYGCTANKNDESIIKGLLIENNYEIEKSIDRSDVLILLTCTVIENTEQRMLSRLSYFKETNKKVIVSGCMASVQRDLVSSIIPDATFLPPRNIYHIVDLLENKVTVFSDHPKTGFEKFYDGVIAPIGIAEGCNYSCSYCITSIARGKLNSYPIEGIIGDIKNATQKGCREIQLTAQDTAQFGFDKGVSLTDLLRNISKIDGNFRVRIGMMNPQSVLSKLDELIDVFEDKKIYKFLHIPVQSGDNEILKIMNRKYSAHDFLKIVDCFRNKYQDITISTDIIVGFPGESEQQFQNSINLIRNIKPDIINITRFSARPNTHAKTIPDRIPTDIVKNRSVKLTKICENISFENNLRHIGKRFCVLVTEIGKNNTFVGRSENYKPVVLKEKVEIGSFFNVEINEAYPTYLVGRLI